MTSYSSYVSVILCCSALCMVLISIIPYDSVRSLMTCIGFPLQGLESAPHCGTIRSTRWSPNKPFRRPNLIYSPKGGRPSPIPLTPDNLLLQWPHPVTPACLSKLPQTSLSVWLTASLLQCYSPLRTKQSTLLHNVPPASQSRKYLFRTGGGGGSGMGNMFIFLYWLFILFIMDKRIQLRLYMTMMH